MSIKIKSLSKRFKKNQSFFYFLSLLFIGLVFFQSCGKGLVNSSNILSSSSSVNLVQRGATLYTVNCSACHGPLAQSAKIGATVDRITIALNTQPAMTSLKNTLSADDILAIEAALAPVQVSPTPIGGNANDITMPESFVALGSRKYVESVLNNAFVDPNGDATTNTFIKGLSSQLVAAQSNAFGGPCSRYDGDCPGGLNADGGPLIGHTPGIATNSLSNPIRMGYRTRVCEQLVENNTAVSQVLKLAGALTTISQATPANITLVFNLFNAGGVVSATTLTSLQTVYNQAITNKYTTTDGWRFVILAICMGPEVDTL